jgi:leader peptidase (prepilin peptidase)/N-methyltransferase
MWWWPLIVAPAIGSFVGVLACRLPRGKGIALSRSACPHCGHALSWRDLIPFASFILLKGRCRYCEMAIGWFYPSIELAALIIALWAVAVLPPQMVWPSVGLGWTLLALAVIDARDGILPDTLTLPLVLAGLAVAGWLDPGGIVDHLLGAVAGFVILAGVALAYRHFRGREGLGLGDAKLLAAAGAWVSWQGLASVILLGATGSLAWILFAALLGRIRLQPSAELPFGPGLCLAIWIVWIHGPLILSQG